MQNNLSEGMIVKRSISPVAVGTTGSGGGTAGKIIDRKGYRGVEFIFSYGTIVATGATYTVIVKEGDVTGTMTSIADADLIGTEAGSVPAAAASRTSAVNKNVSFRLGYKGLKRYVQVAKIYATVTATTPICADVLLYGPEQAPTSPTQ